MTVPVMPASAVSPMSVSPMTVTVMRMRRSVNDAWVRHVHDWRRRIVNHRRRRRTINRRRCEHHPWSRVADDDVRQRWQRKADVQPEVGAGNYGRPQQHHREEKTFFHMRELTMLFRFH